MTKVAFGLLPALLGLLLSGACARTSSRAPDPVQIANPKPAVVGYQRVMASRTIDGASLTSQRRPTAMVVFASWCGHCRKEMAELGKLRKKYPDLRIIGLNAYEEFRNYSDRERLRSYLTENAPWLTEVVHADEDMLGVFGSVPRIPTLFLYDRDGSLVAEFRRDKAPPPSAAELEAAIARAVNSGPT